MKKKLFFMGMSACALAFVLVLAGCDADGGGGGGDKAIEKSVKITGLRSYIGYYFQLGLATSESKLWAGDVAAYTTGTIRSASHTAELYNYEDDEPWTGSGSSYYVVVYLREEDNYESSGFYVISTKKIAFSEEVTTVSFADFREVEPPDYY
jgi:hypothetical protein